MEYLEKLVAGNGSWFSLVLAFAILPLFYLKFAFDMQKEYVDLSKVIFSSNALSSGQKQRLAENSEEALQVFHLEWGLVCAIAILVLANFCAVFMVEYSPFVRGCIVMKAGGGKEAFMSVSLATNAGREAVALGANALAGPVAHCERVKSLLSIYSVVAVLLMLFQIWWAKVTVVRRLRQIYLNPSSQLRKDRPKPSPAVPIDRRCTLGSSARLR